MRQNDINFQPDELGCELGEALAASLGPAIFDGDGASFDPAEFAQSLHKSSRQLALRGRRSRAQKSDGRQLPRLLRARRERPCYRRATKYRDEVAPFHCPECPASRTKPSKQQCCASQQNWPPMTLWVIRDRGGRCRTVV